jgi:hypothetical protein
LRVLRSALEGTAAGDGGGLADSAGDEAGDATLMAPFSARYGSMTNDVISGGV